MKTLVDIVALLAFLHVQRMIHSMAREYDVNQESKPALKQVCSLVAHQRVVGPIQKIIDGDLIKVSDLDQRSGGNAPVLAKISDSGIPRYIDLKCSEQVLKPIVIGKMFHNILYPAVQNVAQPVDGVDFHVFVLTQTVKLGAVYVVVSVKIILRNTPMFHGLPETVVFDHFHTTHNTYLTFSIIPIKYD